MRQKPIKIESNDINILTHLKILIVKNALFKDITRHLQLLQSSLHFGRLQDLTQLLPVDLVTLLQIRLKSD